MGSQIGSATPPGTFRRAAFGRRTRPRAAKTAAQAIAGAGRDGRGAWQALAGAGRLRTAVAGTGPSGADGLPDG